MKDDRLVPHITPSKHKENDEHILDVNFEYCGVTTDAIVNTQT